MVESLAGQQFGGYELLEEIGRGGMAVVYKARQISMNRIVAVKILPRQFVHDKTFRERFQREASIVAQLEHRAIVPVFDYGEHDEQPFIVMRYIDHGSVDDLLDQGPVPPVQVEQIVRQIAAALDYAHAKGVLHRDLKPSNILLDETGDAYLTDFGIARMAGSSTLTTSGVVGTPSYMSPEQAQGLRLDGRSDVYGLAVVLFEMLTAQRPYQSDTPYSVAVMHVTAPIPSARDVNPSISPTIERVIHKGMAKNREERYQTAEALATALGDAVRGVESDPSRIPTKPIVLPRLDFPNEPEAVPIIPPVHYQTSAAMPARLPAPTPPSSVRVAAPSQSQSPRSRSSPRLKRRKAQPWWVNVFLGGLVGLVLFVVLVVIGLLVFGAATGWFAAQTPTSTPPPSTGASITVIPPGVLIPVLTETAAAQGSASNADLNTVNVAEQESGEAEDDPGEATTTPEPEASANIISNASGRIAFYAEREGDAEIFLLNLETGLEQQLTDNRDEDRYPAVSPDGSTIAFASNRDGDEEIFLMDLDGENVRQLTFNNVEDGPPAWSPDGGRLYFATDIRFDGGHDLFRINADGTDLFRLTSGPDKEMHPSASPDGRYLVYNGGNPFNTDTWEIYRLDLQTGVITALTDNSENDWSPTYSPDGSLISFLRRGEGRASLWVMSAAGHNEGLVYDGDGYEWGNAWSPDGQLLAFTGEMGTVQEIYLVALSGGEARKITSGGGAYPSWLPG